MRFRPAFRCRDRWSNLLVATSTLAHAGAPKAPVKGKGLRRTLLSFILVTFLASLVESAISKRQIEHIWIYRGCNFVSLLSI